MRRAWILIVATIAVLASSIATPASAQVTFTNTSAYAGNGRWNWTVMAQAPRATLDRIDCVEYTLHPTFPNPVRTVCRTQSPNFALESDGWGTFQIAIRVIYKDKHVEMYTYQLALSERTVAAPATLRTENWSRLIEPGWWAWGVHITGPPATLAKVKCVEYTLHPSFPNPVRVVCNAQKGFELTTNGWGTFSIPIKVIFKDGTTQALTHQLQLGS
jgi:transcription initiation factor IIF auxiliary subunit